MNEKREGKGRREERKRKKVRGKKGISSGEFHESSLQETQGNEREKTPPATNPLEVFPHESAKEEG